MHLIIYSKWHLENLVCKSHTNNTTCVYLLNWVTDFGKKELYVACLICQCSNQKFNPLKPDRLTYPYHPCRVCNFRGVGWY